MKELKKEAKKVERQQKSKEIAKQRQETKEEPEKKETVEKKEVSETAKGSKYEKQVAKLIRQNLDVSKCYDMTSRIINKWMPFEKRWYKV